MLAACVPDGADDIDTRTGNILNGQTVAATNNPGAVALYHKVRVNGLLVDSSRTVLGRPHQPDFRPDRVALRDRRRQSRPQPHPHGLELRRHRPGHVAPGLTRPPSAVPVRTAVGSCRASDRQRNIGGLAVLHVNSEFPSVRANPARTFIPRWNGGDGRRWSVSRWTNSGSAQPVGQNGLEIRLGRARCADRHTAARHRPRQRRPRISLSSRRERGRTGHLAGDSGGPDSAGTSTLAGSLLQPGPPERRRLQRGHDLRQVSSVDQEGPPFARRHQPRSPLDNALGRADLALVGAATPAGSSSVCRTAPAGSRCPACRAHPISIVVTAGGGALGRRRLRRRRLPGLRADRRDRLAIRPDRDLTSRIDRRPVLRGQRLPVGAVRREGPGRAGPTGVRRTSTAMDGWTSRCPAPRTLRPASRWLCPARRPATARSRRRPTPSSAGSLTCRGERRQGAERRLRRRRHRRHRAGEPAGGHRSGIDRIPIAFASLGAGDPPFAGSSRSRTRRSFR